MQSLATVVAGTLLLAYSVASPVGQVTAPDPRVFGMALQSSLEAVAAAEGPMAVVAESAPVDSAVVAWGGPATRLQRDRQQVAAVMDAGVAVIAGPLGRAHLELLGLRLAQIPNVHTRADFSWSRVIGELTCTEVSTDRWSQLPGLEYTGRLGFEIPQASRGQLVVIVGDELPLAMRGTLADGQPLPLTAEPLSGGIDASAPPPDYWVRTTATRTVPAHVGRIRIAANRSAARYVGLQLGRRAPHVLARLDAYGDSALGSVCAAPLDGEPLAAAGVVEVPLSRDAWMGTGWSPLERDREGVFRRTGASAALLVASEPGQAHRIAVDASPSRSSPTTDETITIVLNGRRLDAQRMRDGTAHYTWDVPPQSWVEGTNELVLDVTATGPNPGVVVRRVTVDFGK